MLTVDEMTDVATDLMVACGDRDWVAQYRRIREVLQGPPSDALGVVTILASSISDRVDRSTGRDVYPLRVVTRGPGGTRRSVSVDVLPPAARVFSQITSALANDDPDMARDLFMGYVNADMGKCARLLSIASGCAAGVPMPACGCPPLMHQ